MTQSVSNLRVRRTQKLLREALIELIEERDFSSLTVGQISERAMVSRAAFYRNYQDKYDLVEKIFEEAMSTLQSAVGDLEGEHSAAIWVPFFEHIASYDRLYRALLGSKGSPWFVRKMRLSLAGLARTHPRRCGQDVHLYPPHVFSDAFVPDLVSALFVEAITWWLEHGCSDAPERIATRTALLASALFKEASIWE